MSGVEQRFGIGVGMVYFITDESGEGGGTGGVCTRHWERSGSCVSQHQTVHHVIKAGNHELWRAIAQASWAEVVVTRDLSSIVLVAKLSQGWGG
jgi:hypothetical protein